MIRALGDVPDASVAKHERNVVLGVDLEDQPHLRATRRAVRILGTLDPAGPAAELVLFGSVNGAGLEVVLALKARPSMVLRVGKVLEPFPTDDLASGLPGASSNPA